MSRHVQMIPLTTAQRVLLTAGSAVGALVNPLRGDLVATLGETTGTLALKNMQNKMKMNRTGGLFLSCYGFIPFN